MSEAIGLSFTEQMKGFYHPDHKPETDYEGAFRLGREDGAYLDFETTIRIEDIDRFLSDPAREGSAEGWVSCKGLGLKRPYRGGLFNLFVPGEKTRQRRMLYQLPFYGDDGAPYLLDGFKDVIDDRGFDLWRDTSTLFTLIRRGHEPGGAVVGTGILTIHIPDFIRQIASFRVHGTDSAAETATTLAKFGRFFAGELWEVFAKGKLPRVRK